MNTVNNICVCGAGTMGAGIAQVFAAHSFRVLLYDLNKETLQNAATRITTDLEKLVARNRIAEEDKQRILADIRYSNNVDDCRGDMIVEAIIEDADAKQNLVNQLFRINGHDTIVVTNTSSLAVNKIAAGIAAPERFAGMHFFNPAPVMQLVEVVRGKLTSETTINTILSVCISIGKKPVLCSDSPGFIVNRVARPYYLEALHVVESANADPGQIDKLMESSGFKMGPFKLMDMIGNDINYAVSTIVYEALNRPGRLKPSPLQEKLVKEGHLGRKSGKGYYEYSR